MNTLAVIGLGYVGLPLVVEFGKHMRTIGFDIATHKVEACRRGTDPSRELEDAQMAEAKHAVYTDDPALLAEADMIIIAVPTPVDEAPITMRNAAKVSGGTKCKPYFITGQFTPQKKITIASKTHAAR